MIRRALEFIPPERLVITTDCGFGREGLSRRIAYYKCVSMVEGTNIVRRELGLPEVRGQGGGSEAVLAQWHGLMPEWHGLMPEWHGLMPRIVSPYAAGSLR